MKNNRIGGSWIGSVHLLKSKDLKMVPCAKQAISGEDLQPVSGMPIAKGCYFGVTTHPYFFIVNIKNQ